MELKKQSISDAHSSQTSLVRMQVTTLLENQSPDYAHRYAKVRSVLEDVKRCIRTLPEKVPVLASQIDSLLEKQFKVIVPFPSFKPDFDAQHRYGFLAPKAILDVGSFALQTMIRHDVDSCIDLAVIMPNELLEAKDYLDYRYVHKRAYYLACIAAGLEAEARLSLTVDYCLQNDNELQPCVILSQIGIRSAISHGWTRIRVLVGPPPLLFRRDKIRPWSTCLRVHHNFPDETFETRQALNSLYNGTIVSDCSIESYHSLLQTTAEHVAGFKDACKLMKIWLRQRQFSSSIRSGGFGHFESASLVALLLEPGNRTTIQPLKSSDGFQLFRTLLQVLAQRNFIDEPVLIGKNVKEFPEAMNLQLPLFYDFSRGHNILFKMSTASYQRLRTEAKISLDTLCQPEPWRFYPSFIARLEYSFQRYDFIATGNLQIQPCRVLSAINKAYHVLVSALSDRVRSVEVRFVDSDSTSTSKWPCISHPPSPRIIHAIQIGIVANPDQVARRVDRGPLADERDAVTKFRELWGDKAELRRFANGEIRESVTWPAVHSDNATIEAIIAYVLKRHFPEGTFSLSATHGDDISAWLSPTGTSAQALKPFDQIERAYLQLQQNLRVISGHPLRIREISAAANGLRYAAVFPEHSQGVIPRPNDVLDVVVQFEGSMRWPEDLAAIQHTKLALLAKIGELLEADGLCDVATVGLERAASTVRNRAVLDVRLDGVTFRLRVYHDREASLLERYVKDKTQAPRDREVAAVALAAHKRMFVQTPRHTQAVRELCTRMPLLASTMRLFKSWVATHLLSSHFSEELLELMVINVFTFPYPYAAPGGLRSAFLRTLSFIARWDWRNEPLVTNFATTIIPRSDLDDITTKFQAWRKIDPGMHRMVAFVASNIDHDGSTWTTAQPTLVAMNRLAALAQAACAEVSCGGLDFNAAPLFARSLHEFDFIIHLNQNWHQQSGASRLVDKSKLKPSDAALAQRDFAISAFIEEAEQICSGLAIFFHNGGLVPVIGGLWTPKPPVQEWKVGTTWCTTPTKKSGETEVTVRVNNVEILYQIARLGGELVSGIVRQDTGATK